MSRINTNIPSLIARRVLTGQNDKLNTALARLSTGMRINSGRDDPAGLIASETLRLERNATQAAMNNITRASNVIATAEGGLVEVNNLLTELEELIDRSANEGAISVTERNANQLQIDAILNSIDRIANSTEFQGRKLLSGELDYTTSGVTSSDITQVTVNSARLANNGTRTVNVDVTASAQLATLTYAASATGAGGTTLEVAGNLGTETISFGSNAAIAEVAAAVNQSRDLTGVSATVVGTELQFNSIKYGSSQFVSVRAINGTFTVTGGDAGATKDRGRDATVQINGVAAVTDGLRATIRSGVLSVDLDMTAAFGASIGSTSFTIVGGGADFQISPRVDLNGLASLGIGSVSTGNLGNDGSGDFLASIATGGANQLSSGNYGVAQRIVRTAADQISQLRGRLGAFERNTLATMASSLRVTYENITTAESVIRDTDFAEQTSELTRSQILVQSATNTLRLANASPQNVLALLG